MTSGPSYWPAVVRRLEAASLSQQLLQAHDQSHPLDETLAAQQLLQRQMEQLVDGWPGSQAANGRDDLAGRSLNRSGQLVGRYRLMELLGEGGFGQVYVGQQRQPVRRLVAVKLPPGMDTRSARPLRSRTASPGDDESSPHRPSL